MDFLLIQNFSWSNETVLCQRVLKMAKITREILNVTSVLDCERNSLRNNLKV